MTLRRCSIYIAQFVSKQNNNNAIDTTPCRMIRGCFSRTYLRRCSSAQCCGARLAFRKCRYRDIFLNLRFSRSTTKRRCTRGHQVYILMHRYQSRMWRRFGQTRDEHQHFLDSAHRPPAPDRRTQCGARKPKPFIEK